MCELCLKHHLGKQTLNYVWPEHVSNNQVTLQTILTESWFNERKSHSKLTTLLSVYVLKGYILSLDHYYLERCCIMKPDVQVRYFQEYSTRPNLVQAEIQERVSVYLKSEAMELRCM